MKNEGLSGLNLPDLVSAICAGDRQLAVRLDRLISLMEQAAGQDVEVFQRPSSQIVIGLEGVKSLLGMSLASYPRDHATIQVGTTAAKLVENNSDGWISVFVTNLDNAQDLAWGNSTVKPNSGPLIPGKSKEKIHIPPSSNLYGIVGAGSISVAVSTLIVPDF